MHSRRLTHRAAVAVLALTAALTLGAALGGCSGGGAAAPDDTASAVTAPAPGPPDTGPDADPDADSAVDVRHEIADLEARYDAVVGLYALDTGTGRVAAHRADDRFAFASTYKALAAGALLERDGTAGLDRVVTYTADDLVPYSPVAERHVTDGLTVRQVIDAAVRESDNTAGNLLFDALGGPAGLQAALRAAGDGATVSARPEPDLNDVPAGDERDTSTPRALAEDLRAYALGDRLDDDARAVLVEALRGSTTGDGTIRAGVPDGWTVGSKTGTSAVGTRNDVGVVWPPDGDPVVLAVLTQLRDRDAEPDDALLAQVTAVAVRALTS
ncbi:class A beta-lactamase [Promicromonospora thailandica]|uniref:Beta-lactamase n=1 Tax=Promicromonospora thailandica TaxID=765201 RepID=A0A9X2G402_9MICO|nr:class A beta-lactamase [Promicromonospora thailandica]MCP2266692.1 beta-lactamase class A [Promicromonospora thailandica]